MSEKRNSTESSGLVNLQSVNLVGAAYDLRTVEYLRISSSTLMSCTFSDLTGDMDLGVGLELSRFQDCTFRRCNIARLSFGYALFQSCRFEDCDIRELWSHDANFDDCVFSGHLRTGAFSLGAGNPMFSHESRYFEGNDFSRCVIHMSLFRGGIDLTKQAFCSTDGSIVIEDVRSFAGAVKAHLAATGSLKVSRNLQALLSTVASDVERFQQQHVFVPGHVMRGLGSDESWVRLAASKSVGS